MVMEYMLKKCLQTKVRKRGEFMKIKAKIKLINDERKSSKCLSAKASNECNDSTAIDICYYIDKAHCVVHAYDQCNKDFAACSSGADDYCGRDYDSCIGAGQFDAA